MENLSITSETIFSIVAMILSIFAFLHGRRQLYVDIIAKHRIEHMGKLTNLIYEFIDACTNNDIDTAKTLRYKIIVNLSPNNDVHKTEIMRLNECIAAIQSNSSDPKELDELALNSQILFKHIWEEAKSESYSRKFRRNKPGGKGWKADEVEF